MERSDATIEMYGDDIYIVAQTNDVDELMSEGYGLVGGVSAVYNPGIGTVYYQSMLYLGDEPEEIEDLPDVTSGPRTLDSGPP